MSRPGDEETVPRGYLLKSKGSELTLEDFFQWMAKSLAPKLHLLGGAEFLDSMPLSNVGFHPPLASVGRALILSSRPAMESRIVVD
jgi:hypothetical protein